MFFDNFHGVSSLVCDPFPLVRFKRDLHGRSHVRFPGCLSIKLDQAAFVGEVHQDEEAAEDEAGFEVGGHRHQGN